MIDINHRSLLSHVLGLSVLAVSLGLLTQGCATLSSSEEEESSPATTSKEGGLTMKQGSPWRGGTRDLASRDPQVAKERLRVADGYAVSLFASEHQFPELRNPVAIAWDARGRLWVSTMPYYPQYLPGHPPNDKILILEDTDDDGRADRRRIQLRSFGTGDTHHAISALTWGPGGSLYFQEGTFLFSRVETPHGSAPLCYGEV